MAPRTLRARLEPHRAGSFSGRRERRDGGASQLSSIVTAGAVVLTLLFFTGCFERVLKAVLGSILTTPCPV